jgi:ParB-like chromosome segregation protein Spo0J
MAEPRTHDLTVETVEIDSIAAHPRNPRVGNVDSIVESYLEHSQYQPIIVQRSTGYVLAGNHRLKAARALGWDSIKAIFIDVDDDEAARILLVDNRTSDLGTYDEQVLADLLGELPDLAGTGYTPDDLSSLLEGLADDALGAEDEGEKLAESFQILVTCDSEAHQATLLNKMSSEGLMVRALIS